MRFDGVLKKLIKGKKLIKLVKIINCRFLFKKLINDEKINFRTLI